MSKQDQMEFIAHMQETAQAQLMPPRGRLERAGIDIKPGWRTEIERLDAEAAALRRERDELAARLAEIERAEPAQAQPCRTCGPDKCPDSVSCPRGAR